MHKKLAKTLDLIQDLFKQALGVDLITSSHRTTFSAYNNPANPNKYVQEIENLILYSPNLLYPYPKGTEYVEGFVLEPLTMTLLIDKDEFSISLLGTGRLQTGLCMLKILTCILPIPAYALYNLEQGLNKMELGSDDSFIGDADFDLYVRDIKYRKAHGMPALFPERVIKNLTRAVL